MGHRFFAAIVGGLIIWTAVAAMTRAVGNTLAVWTARILAIAFIVQILLGASVVFEGFSAQSKAIHLSAATVVWVALMFLAAAVYTSQGFEFRRVGDGPTQVAGSERLA